MLGTVGTYTLSSTDENGLGQLRQRSYAAIVSAEHDDGTLDVHVLFTRPAMPVMLRQFVAVGDGEPGSFQPSPEPST